MAKFVELTEENKPVLVNLDRVVKVILGEGYSDILMDTGAIIYSMTPVEELRKVFGMVPVVHDPVCVSSYDYPVAGHRVMLKQDHHEVLRGAKWVRVEVPAGSVGEIAEVYEADWEPIAKVVVDGIEGTINTHCRNLVRLLVDKPSEG